MIQIHQSLREFILHFFHFRIFLNLLLLQSIFRPKETDDFYKEIKNKGPPLFWISLPGAQVPACFDRLSGACWVRPKEKKQNSPPVLKPQEANYGVPAVWNQGEVWEPN